MIYDYKEVFIESNRIEYPLDIFTDQELRFIESKKLITISKTHFKVNFVGEIITPENKFFSLPKNFRVTEQNVDIFKKVLKDYNKVSGKSLLFNNTFIITKTGDIKSEKFYFNELKNYFLDFITYEFIYPSKTLKKHSASPISGGKIDIFSTMRNRKSRGPGITYKVKDIKNSNSWNLDDIYWSVIEYLSKKYNDYTEIFQMKRFLESEGYVLNTIDISNSEKMLSDINKCDVGIIHNPIKNVLLSYFKSTSVSECYKINAFYTDNFAFVWEELMRLSLRENKLFRDELKSNFYRKETRRKWFPDELSISEFLQRNRVRVVNKDSLKNGFRVSYEIDVKSIPDIFSEYNSKRFIGDAKYYQDPENAEFEKEFRTYNQLMNNEYPMVVFIPSNRTKVLHVREEGELELVIFNISVEKSISDVVNKTNMTIDTVQTLLWDKGYTKRK